MKDDIIAGIYETFDYGKFRYVKGNRRVTKRRLNKLIKSFSEGQILKPIMVNEKMEIVDGQGSFEACRQLGLPIYYYIAPNTGAIEMTRLNTASTNWATVDYAEMHESEGNENYIRLLEMFRAHPENNFTAIRKSTACSETSSIVNGSLKFTEENVERGEAVLKMAEDIVRITSPTRKINAKFYTAVGYLYAEPNYKHKRMLTQLKKHPDLFVMSSSTRDQLVTFSNIYNYGATPKLYFERALESGKNHNNNRNYNETKSASQDRTNVSTLKR